MKHELWGLEPRLHLPPPTSLGPVHSASPSLPLPVPPPPCSFSRAGVYTEAQGQARVPYRISGWGVATGSWQKGGRDQVALVMGQGLETPVRVCAHPTSIPVPEGT